jgi:hypothetical protein
MGIITSTENLARVLIFDSDMEITWEGFKWFLIIGVPFMALYIFFSD